MAIGISSCPTDPLNLLHKKFYHSLSPISWYYLVEIKRLQLKSDLRRGVERKGNKEPQNRTQEVR